MKFYLVLIYITRLKFKEVLPIGRKLSSFFCKPNQSLLVWWGLQKSQYQNLNFLRIEIRRNSICCLNRNNGIMNKNWPFSQTAKNGSVSKLPVWLNLNATIWKIIFRDSYGQIKFNYLPQSNLSWSCKWNIRKKSVKSSLGLHRDFNYLRSFKAYLT